MAPEDLSVDHSHGTSVAIGFGIALPIIAVSLRLVSRYLRQLDLKSDDYMIIFGATITIANACIGIWTNKAGNGRHVKTLSKVNVEQYYLTLFAFEQTFGVSICAVKLSVLLLYRRIFSTPVFRIWALVIGILTIMWAVVMSLCQAFQCSPVRKAWDKDSAGHCSLNFMFTIIGGQAFNFLFDIIILMLPITAISRLQMPRWKRLSIIAVFAVGGLTTIVALVRLIVIAHELLTHGTNTADITWTTAKISWTIIDPAVGCFAACMPTWSPLVKPLQSLPESFSSSFRSFFSRSRSTGYKGQGKMEDDSAQCGTPGYDRNSRKNSAHLAWVGGAEAKPYGSPITEAQKADRQVTSLPVISVKEC